MSPKFVDQNNSSEKELFLRTARLPTMVSVSVPLAWQLSWPYIEFLGSQVTGMKMTSSYL